MSSTLLLLVSSASADWLMAVYTAAAWLSPGNGMYGTGLLAQAFVTDGLVLLDFGIKGCLQLLRSTF